MPSHTFNLIREGSKFFQLALDAAAPPEKRFLAHWVLRIRLHVVGPRGDHKASGRQEIFRCKTQVSRAITKRVVSFIGPADR